MFFVQQLVQQIVKIQCTAMALIPVFVDTGKRPKAKDAIKSV